MGFFLPILLDFSALVSRLLIIQPLFYSGGIVGFLSLVFLCDRVSNVLGGTDLWMKAMPREVLSLPYVFIVL